MLKSKSVNIIHTTYHRVPQDWQVFSLNNIAQEIKERYSKDKDGPILSVTKYKGFVESLKYFKKRIYSKDIKNYKLVENGDFAYATIHLDEGSLGLLKEFKRGYISPMYTVFRTNSSINKDFLYYLLKSNMYIQIYKSLGEGSINRRKSISFDDLSKLKIPIPPLNEQQKIASILSNVNELIQKTEKIIEQTQRLKNGIMQRLFTKGIGHTKFKNIELGFKFLKLSVPFDWNVLKLEELVKFKDTPHYTSPNFDYGIPVIRTSDCTSDGKIDYNNTKFTSEEEYEKRRKIIDPEVGDILYTREAPPGIASLVDRKKISIGQRIVLLKPLTKITGKYLLYFLNSKFGTLQANAMTLKTTVEHVNIEDIKKFKITVPSLAEQENITNYIENFDDKIFSLTNHLYCWKNLKRGLMQQLLTGRIRV